MHRLSRGGPHAEHLVELLCRQRPVRPRDRAQYLAVKLDLVKRNTIVDAKIKIFGNRVHLPGPRCFVAKWSRRILVNRLRRPSLPPHDPCGPFMHHPDLILLRDIPP